MLAVHKLTSTFMSWLKMNKEVYGHDPLLQVFFNSSMSLPLWDYKGQIQLI